MKMTIGANIKRLRADLLDDSAYVAVLEEYK